MRLRIGTRASALAMAQATRVQRELLAIGVDSEIVPVSTQGDVDKVRPLSEIGGKGVFIKGVEDALLDGRADIAVHSFKDVTSELAPGLVLAGALTAESNSDVLVLRDGLEGFPEDGVVLTGSMRREVFLKELYPKVSTRPIRGNLETRLKTLDQSDAHAVMVSEVGLLRLGIERRTIAMDSEVFLPAPGQGVIALECRESDAEIVAVLEKLSDVTTLTQMRCEFAILGMIGFDCRIPFGLLTRVVGDSFQLKMGIRDADGNVVRTELETGDLQVVASRISSLKALL